MNSVQQVATANPRIPPLPPMQPTILHLIPSLKPSGNAHELRALLNEAAFVESKVPSWVFSYNKTDAPMEEWLKEVRNPYVRGVQKNTHFPGETEVRTIFEVLKNGIRPTTVHIWDESLMATGVGIARWTGAKTVATFRHADPWREPPHAAWFAQIDHLVANQLGVRRFYESRGRRGHWEVIPDVLDTWELPSEEKHARIRKELLEALGLPDDVQLVGCIGPDRPWKRWRWAIWSIDSIVRIHPKVHLLFLDNSPKISRSRLELETFTRQYEREKIVHFLPEKWTTGVKTRDVISQLELVWQPNSTPGSGLGLLEAAWCGVPVIAAEVEGLAETLPECGAQFVPPFGETIALASAAHRVLLQGPNGLKGAATEKVTLSSLSYLTGISLTYQRFWI